MNKLLLFLLLSASLCFAFTSGDGTYENPYEIAGQSDIVNLIDMVATNDCSGLYFLQTADIDLTSFGNFHGIGSISSDLATTNAFSGDYDGGGYWVSNLYISAGAQRNHRGFFNAVADATLQNISVQGYITCACWTSGGSIHLGGVVGSAKGNLLFEGLTANVREEISMRGVSSGREENRFGIGGVIGFIDQVATTTLTALENRGDISLGGTIKGGVCAGGVIGKHIRKTTLTTQAVLSNFKNYGKISLKVVEPYSFNSDNNNTPAIAGIVSSIGYPTKIVSAENYGDIEGNDCWAGGVCCFGGSGSASARCDYLSCVNYGDIDFGSRLLGWYGVGGCVGGNAVYGYSNGLTNYGNIRAVASSNVLSRIHIGGVSFAGRGSGSLANSGAISLVNYGDVIVSNSNPNAGISVGGVMCHGVAGNFTEQIKLYKSTNYGKVKVYSSVASADDYLSVAGVCSLTTFYGTKDRDLFCGNLVNFGDVYLSIPFDTIDGFADISGLVSARDYGYKNEVVMSNSYNFGDVYWEGKGIFVGGLMGEIDTSHNSSDYTYLRNCYSVNQFFGQTNDNYVGSLVGHAYGQYPLGISNCFAITKGVKTIGSLGGTASTNNLATFNYEEAYHNPSITQGYLYNYAFTQANTTNEWADLTLPINKLIFPTITEAIRKKHTYTSVMGYKRYVKTNRK